MIHSSSHTPDPGNPLVPSSPERKVSLRIPAIVVGYFLTLVLARDWLLVTGPAAEFGEGHGTMITLFFVPKLYLVGVLLLVYRSRTIREIDPNAAQSADFRLWLKDALPAVTSIFVFLCATQIYDLATGTYSVDSTVLDSNRGSLIVIVLALVVGQGIAFPTGLLAFTVIGRDSTWRPGVILMRAGFYILFDSLFRFVVLGTVIFSRIDSYASMIVTMEVGTIVMAVICCVALSLTLARGRSVNGNSSKWGTVY